MKVFEVRCLTKPILEMLTSRVLQKPENYLDGNDYKSEEVCFKILI